MRDNPKANKQMNGGISLKGFGAVKSEFVRFTNHIKDVMNKNVIYVFHSQEQADKDGNPQQRLMCEGAAKNIVWTPCDFGGFVQMIGNQRCVFFSPEQEFFAKGCHGIRGKYVVPELGPSDSNDFITKLFDQAKKNIADESKAYEPLKTQYDAVMLEVKAIIDGVVDAETAQAASTTIQELPHALTSKKESAALLKSKLNSIGLKFSNGQIVPKE